MTKNITISARIPQEDAEFLSQLEISDAKTPSEKLRALITETRQRSQQTRDFSGCLTAFQDMLKPIKNGVYKSELSENMHSELISRVMEWVPHTLAYIISQEMDKLDRDKLMLFEKGLNDRIFHLIEATLQLAIAQKPSCYTPDFFKDKIAALQDLLAAINHVRNSSQHKEEL